MSGDISIVTTGGGASRRGGSQGCCQASYRAQNSPQLQRIIQPQMSVVPRLRIPVLEGVNALERKKKKKVEWGGGTERGIWVGECDFK